MDRYPNISDHGLIAVVTARHAGGTGVVAADR